MNKYATSNCPMCMTKMRSNGHESVCPVCGYKYCDHSRDAQDLYNWDSNHNHNEYKSYSQGYTTTNTTYTTTQKQGNITNGGTNTRTTTVSRYGSNQNNNKNNNKKVGKAGKVIAIVYIISIIIAIAGAVLPDLLDELERNNQSFEDIFSDISDFFSDAEDNTNDDNGDFYVENGSTETETMNKSYSEEIPVLGMDLGSSTVKEAISYFMQEAEVSQEELINSTRILAIMYLDGKIYIEVSGEGLGNYVYESPYSDFNVKDLAVFNQVETLYVDNMKLSEGALMDFSSVRSLYCSNSVAEITKIIPCDNLEILQLIGHDRDMDMTGIEQFVNLSRLQVYADSISNTEKISELTEMIMLTMEVNELPDMKFLKEIPQLYFLIMKVGGEEVEDLTFLSELKTLQGFEMYETHIKSLKGLGECPKLEQIALYECPLLDYSELEKTTLVYDLDAIGCGIKDVEFVKNYTQLQFLDIHNNEITDLSPLADMAYLETVYAAENPLNEKSQAILEKNNWK